MPDAALKISFGFDTDQTFGDGAIGRGGAGLDDQHARGATAHRRALEHRIRPLRQRRTGRDIARSLFDREGFTGQCGLGDKEVARLGRRRGAKPVGSGRAVSLGDLEGLDA